MRISVIGVMICILITQLVCGCNSSTFEVETKLEELGADYHRDEFDEFCWIRVHENSHAQGILEFATVSGLHFDAIYLTDLPLSCSTLEVLNSVEGKIEVDLDGGTLPNCDSLITSVWKLRLHSVSFDLVALAKFPNLEVVVLDARTLSVELVSELNRLVRLRQLTLVGRLRTEDIEVLQGLSNVESVNFVSSGLDAQNENLLHLRSRFAIGMDGKWRRAIKVNGGELSNGSGLNGT
ncbi:hypothetical protein [Rhodopirellula europaea]|uniref:hypothetical protein n=1 Tax=Rhodopirellula europaea TaxID=1263866 RepID=UPI003D2C981B